MLKLPGLYAQIREMGVETRRLLEQLDLLQDELQKVHEKEELFVGYEAQLYAADLRLDALREELRESQKQVERLCRESGYNLLPKPASHKFTHQLAFLSIIFPFLIT